MNNIYNILSITNSISCFVMLIFYNGRIKRGTRDGEIHEYFS